MDNKQKIQAYVYFVKVFVPIFLFIELGKSETISEKCYTENNATLICNYIPKILSRYYDHIRILDFKRKYQNVSLDSSTFADESWVKIQTIEFNDATDEEFSFSRKCFQGLRSLKELKIHVNSFKLNAEAFVGLPLVYTLDVSKCYRLVIEEIFNALKAKSALPRLKKLIMSETGIYVGGSNNINQREVNYVFPRKLTKLDLSRTQINFVNLTALFKTMKTLKNINASYSVIGDTWHTGLVQKDLMNLKVIDLTHVILPVKTMPIIPGKYVYFNKTGKYSDLTIYLKTIMKNVFTPLIINVSSIVPETVSVWIYNCTVTLNELLGWKVEQLIVRKNNMKYLDVKLVCPVYKFTSVNYLDLSENSLEMIHPLMCVPNLETIDLSKNKMFKMLENNPNLFEKLFASLSKLRKINLSNNQLLRVPHSMFKHIRHIETIDLSFNRLEQLHLDLMNLHRLRMLDVRSNMIKILDEFTIKSLNRIPDDDRCTIIMTSNPFLCSTCSCKLSIQWLLSSKLVNAKQQDLLCVTEAETLVDINESVARKILTICNREVAIILSTVCSITLVFTLFIIGIALYRRRSRRQRKKNMENVIVRLRTGAGKYEFVTFLSYSSRDDHLVQEYVIDPLNENLKRIIETDRNLICTGDQHLRPGFRLHDETDHCLDRVSVVLFVVSDNFCQSSHCQNEFDQAYLARKPVVLMILGNVDEELMMPTLKRLYNRDVRILLKNENGLFVPTTTWGTVCSSILEKVQI